jgi:hypothetical protein
MQELLNVTTCLILPQNSKPTDTTTDTGIFDESERKTTILTQPVQIFFRLPGFGHKFDPP